MRRSARDVWRVFAPWGWDWHCDRQAALAKFIECSQSNYQLHYLVAYVAGFDSVLKISSSVLWIRFQLITKLVQPLYKHVRTFLQRSSLEVFFRHLLSFLKTAAKIFLLVCRLFFSRNNWPVALPSPPTAYLQDTEDEHSFKYRIAKTGLMLSNSFTSGDIPEALCVQSVASLMWWRCQHTSQLRNTVPREQSRQTDRHGAPGLSDVP